MKTIYYYQTPCLLDEVIKNSQNIDIIIVSSIHFGKFKGESYIHLNDNYPSSPKYDEMWENLRKLYYDGMTIMCMIGGAGGGFQNLLSDYDIYYPMLKEFLKMNNIITGLDLDVEEEVDVNDIKKLIKDLKNDFGEDFTITMAPVADSLTSDNPSGFSGINYKELLDSEIGYYISWLNVQAYGCFNFETYDKIIKNGYYPEKIIFGMISGDFINNDFSNAIIEIKKIVKQYPNFSGCDVWELVNAPPDMNNHSKWALEIKNIDYSKRDFLGIWAP